MEPKRELITALFLKLAEQIERIEHLISLTPEAYLESRPVNGGMRVCEVLGHLLECLAGFCAALQKLHPVGLEHFDNLKHLPVNHCCGIEEALSRVQQYRAHIEEGFAPIRDQDLERTLATLFVPEGEPGLSILLGNLEHLINHKYQLFIYLKALGVSVATPDLYRIRG